LHRLLDSGIEQPRRACICKRQSLQYLGGLNKYAGKNKQVNTCHAPITHSCVERKGAHTQAPQSLCRPGRSRRSTAHPTQWPRPLRHRPHLALACTHSCTRRRCRCWTHSHRRHKSSPPYLHPDRGKRRRTTTWQALRRYRSLSADAISRAMADPGLRKCQCRPATSLLHEPQAGNTRITCVAWLSEMRTSDFG
jgi:hypothetical protein